MAPLKESHNETILKPVDVIISSLVLPYDV
jgi:hypothetical protein